MQQETHPQYHPVIFKDGDHEIVTRSTMTSGKTRDVDGVDHFVIPIEISAFSHPFYTGKQKLVDTEGRVDRFMKRYDLHSDDDDPSDDAAADDSTAADESTNEQDADQ